MRNGISKNLAAVGYSAFTNKDRSPSTNNQTNDSTPTQPPRTRVALASKDNNAKIPINPKDPTKRGIIMPPPEKQPNNHSRPVLISTQKPSSRNPLTPRIAGTGPTSPAFRRGPRSETNGSAFVAQKEEQQPASSFLSTNITPRSGTRRSRIDSPTSTPTCTPTPSAPVPRFADPPRGGSVVGGHHSEEAKRPSVTFAPASEFKGQSKSHQDPDSKFFFASDARTPAQSLPTRPNLQSKGSAFFYANGDSIPPVTKSSSSAVGSATGDERPSPMFFRANSTQPTSGHSTHSNISINRTASPRLAAHPAHPPSRPASPLKLDSHSSVVSSRSTVQHSPHLPPRPNIAGSRGQSSQSVVTSRRVSTDLRPPNSRSVSISSFEITPPARIGTRKSIEGLPVTPSNFTSVITTSTPEESREERDELRDIEEHGLGSPIRAGGTLEQMNELAAEARRDRKVLDLEITNSSLEAINRTLERQLRKQNAELRRYRRLSRSGRLSLANPPGGDYSIMGGMVDAGDLTDMSEGDEDEEDDDDQEDITSEGEESMDDGSLSPGAMAESDARHLQKDEKRFRLDISKHQQLIADSQAMNTSIKRCLNWTEELIAEGKKALEYSVRPGDIHLGGHVLVPEEMENDEMEGLSEIGAGMLRQARQKRHSSLSPSASSFGDSNRGSDNSWFDRGADRDSGIELPSNYRPDGTNPTFTASYNTQKMEHPAPP